MALDDLFTGTPTTVNTQSSSGSPAWLQSYLQGIANKGLDIASTPYQPYTGQRLADFTAPQQQAFNAVQNNVGDYQPSLNNAQTSAASILPTAINGINQANQYSAGALGAAQQAAGTAGAQGNQYAAGATGAANSAINTANNAVAGSPQTWTQNYQQYMSPYTSSVVDEIARQGNENLMNNIIPGVQSSFLGSGQFGSTRNADMLGRAVSNAQQNISGQQAQALESGYNTAANTFNADANRAQTQQQLQANTALTGGQLGSSSNLGAGNLTTGATIQGGQLVSGAGNNAASIANQGAGIGAQAAASQAAQQGTLASLQQQLGNQDVNSLMNIGGLQQQQNQAGLTTSYNDFLNQQGYDKNQLGYLNSLITGMPNQTATTQTNTVTPATPSTYSWLNALGGLSQVGNQLSS